MTRKQEQFEDSIRDGLSRLADEAPPGPAGEQIVRTLRRRRLRRRALAGAAAVAAAVVVALTIPGPGPAPRTIARGQGDSGPVAGTMTDREIRQIIMREAQAGGLVAATEILAEAPGSQEDVRKMRQFILSEYAGTKAAEALANLKP